jgi:hypothetical protein
MNQLPKTSYQDFLKDIYSAMKKISQSTTDIFTKLESLDNRLTNLEKSYMMVSTDIKKLINHAQVDNETGLATSTTFSPNKKDSSKLLSLLTQLNDSVNDTGIDVYTLGSSIALNSTFNNDNGLFSTEHDSVYADISTDTNNDFMILE